MGDDTMGKLRLDKSQTPFLVAIIITVAAQAFEKIIEVAVDVNQFTGLVCAMVYTLLVAVVYYIISKGTGTLMGILSAMLALKMMPPKMGYLTNVSVDGAMLYFLVSKVAVVLFAVLVYKFYREQETPHPIKGMPILVVLFAVPFFNEIASFASSYLLGKTGSMLLPYFAQYACYAAAVLITFAIAFISSKDSMRFVAYFEFCALGINTLRQIGKIGYLAISHQHISKSIYGWIVVLVVLAAVGAFMLAKSKKKEA